jgi:hypothetical protein
LYFHNDIGEPITCSANFFSLPPLVPGAVADSRGIDVMMICADAVEAARQNPAANRQHRVFMADLSFSFRPQCSRPAVRLRQTVDDRWIGALT